MHHSLRRLHLAPAALALGLALALVPAAFAQTPPLPSCDITVTPNIGSFTVAANTPFDMCGPSGVGLHYHWFNAANVQINSDETNPCVHIGGLAPGVYDFELVDFQTLLPGMPYVKCPFEIVVPETPPPPPGLCWLTGGGAKTVDGQGDRHSFGGNVNPGCSPTAGDGGNWNDIDHTNGLHFQGRSITVLRCGNIPGIPPGSTSPVTPFNYIEFTGQGRLDGVSGNSTSIDPVFFFGHYEDRGEPGTNDHYFLRVYTNPGDPVGSTVMLVDNDGDPSTIDPTVVTHGNLQLHISGCDKNAAPAAGRVGGIVDENTAAVALPTEVFLAPARPNPTQNESMLRFGLPRDADASLRIFDVAGRQVSELARGTMPAGQYSVRWDLRDRSGARVARGLYFARLVVGGQAYTQAISVTR